jgi:hypothetical protein
MVQKIINGQLVERARFIAFGDKLVSTDDPLPVEVVGEPVPEASVAAIGAIDDAAYADDTGAADGTVVALLKGIYVQNAAIIALLTDIEANTGGA